VVVEHRLGFVAVVRLVVVHRQQYLFAVVRQLVLRVVVGLQLEQLGFQLELVL
jgi:hypothetical protein